MNRSIQQIAIALFLAGTAAAQTAGKFEVVAKYRDLGGAVASIVAPGPAAGSERLYVSFLYNESTIDVIGVDPQTGATDVYHSPIVGDFGARNAAIGPDGNVYFGTLPHAHFLKLDRKLGKLIDLGQPAPGEQYIWDVAFGADGKLYGATYPGCKLVQYDPATSKLRDLGAMDPTEQYGRWIVGGKDGFVYVGIGTTHANIAAYNTATGKHAEIFPSAASEVGTAKVYRGTDGNVYGAIGKHLFRLHNGTAEELPAGTTVAAATQNLLHDGSSVEFSAVDGTVSVTNPTTHAKATHKINYDGNTLQLFRVAFGPDGFLYGSSVLPIHFVKLNPATHRIERITNLGGGEVYSFLAHDGHLLMGAYSALSPLLSYMPGAPAHPAANDGNPRLISHAGLDEAWRPQAMIEGNNGNVYIGAIAGYGILQEPLVEWNTQQNDIQLYDNIVPNQSLSSLTAWRNYIVGGSTVYGGGGSHETEQEAQLFLWNTSTHIVSYKTISVYGEAAITDLITAPNGFIYGIASDERPAMLQQSPIAHEGATLFVFDPAARKIVAAKPLSFAHLIYNSVTLAADGSIYGLAEEGIFRIDTKSNTAGIIAPSPEKITGGFAVRDGDIYFISGSTVYRYKM